MARHTEKVSRRGLLQSGVAGSLALSTIGRATRAQAQASRPNFVFIMADDLGYADVSCYGQRDYTTPNIDRLATEGLRFTQAYSNSAVCSPTRVGLMTGRYQYRLPVGLEEPISPATAMELLKVVAKLDITHVPYKGGAPAIIDLIAGRLDVMFATASSVGGHVRSTKLRAIAVTSATRSPAYPELPTVAEAGVPGFEAIAWFGVLAPAGTPAEVITRLNASVTIAAQAESFVKRSADDGLVISIEGPAALAKLLIIEQARWQRVVREANIKPD